MAKEERVKDALMRLDLIPKKSKGQNFLIDKSALESIVTFGAPKPGDKIVEIGPGLGALTEILSKYDGLTVIEIEPKFCREIKAKFPQVNVVESDVRVVDFSELGDDLIVFGNLPYSFSTDIIFHLVAFSSNIKRAVLLLQREFAERLAAPPGGKDYGVLSVSCQLHAKVRLGAVIRGDSFHPPTEVESRVVELEFPKEPQFKVDDIVWVKRVVAAAFSQRRKMLHNSLRGSRIADGDVIDRALEAAGILGTRRPETLSIPEFIKLAENLGKPIVSPP